MRYNAIDLLRGLAVTGMMLFHANYLLEHVFDRDVIPLGDGFWSVLGPSVAIVFISLAGLVSVLSAGDKSIGQIVRKTLKRTLILALCACTISVITYSFIPAERISWGILHFLALASILGLFTFRIRYLSFFFGIAILSVPYFLDISLSSIFLIPFGFPPLDYYSADYYPLIPWFGYYFIGQGFARLFLKKNLLRYVDTYIPRIPMLIWIGRHALLLYMVHMPILFLLLGIVLLY